MNPLLEQLHDIEGIDAISPWPLAMGWWIFIIFAFLIMCTLLYLLIRKIAFRRSWKYDTLQKLDDLERNLSDSTARETVMELSEYLRRIALRRFPRKECAGLTGKSWLKWLVERDPKGFDWVSNGTLLINAPYAPVNQKLSSKQTKELIQAVRNWVV